MKKRTSPKLWTNLAATLIATTFISGAQSKPDPFYLPQVDQPFGGTVETRIGKLEFDNQYPSTAILDKPWKMPVVEQVKSSFIGKKAEHT